MSSREPYLGIVKGDATPEEIAALVAALAAQSAARAADAARSAAPRTSLRNWRNPAHHLRVGLPRGPGAWRRAFFPGG
ncbi:acyl-CoA carboxylase epsilon subunit [Microbispora sp. CSR-4]|uniref:acyl-CoA carboxylase epsilon subunit n=1 Tax=Microbispora sp. CSR-4 TaxID=2592813 RepID=UPI0011CC60B4|nr:acyl-CoA carboxylase epsilon subunit [Microbispora sp. CSR-4]